MKGLGVVANGEGAVVLAKGLLVLKSIVVVATEVGTGA